MNAFGKMKANMMKDTIGFKILRESQHCQIINGGRSKRTNILKQL